MTTETSVISILKAHALKAHTEFSISPTEMWNLWRIISFQKVLVFDLFFLMIQIL